MVFLFFNRIAGSEPLSVIVPFSGSTSSCNVDLIGGSELPFDDDSTSGSNFCCSSGVEWSESYEFIGERAFLKLVSPNFPSITC